VSSASIFATANKNSNASRTVDTTALWLGSNGYMAVRIQVQQEEEGQEGQERQEGAGGAGGESARQQSVLFIELDQLLRVNCST
jgi:hypothetical protein